jgi:hypothetical protein
MAVKGPFSLQRLCGINAQFPQGFYMARLSLFAVKHLPNHNLCENESAVEGSSL